MVPERGHRPAEVRNVHVFSTFVALDEAVARAVFSSALEPMDPRVCRPWRFVRLAFSRRVADTPRTADAALAWGHTWGYWTSSWGSESRVPATAKGRRRWCDNAAS